MDRTRAFTLLEIILAIFIALLVLSVTIPSIRGVFAERALNETFEQFDDLVREAQSRSVTERQPYVLEWTKEGVVLRPQFVEGELRLLEAHKGETYAVTLPAALQKNSPPLWTFWPTGTAEPVVVSYDGPRGKWSAHYDPLTVRGEFLARDIY